MANIDLELSIIGEKGGKGEDIRAAIISAINKIAQEREYVATTKKFTSNTGPEGETGGPWNKVIVQVDGTASIDNIDSCGTITENGYYTIKDLINIGLVDNPNSIGVDGFSVEVGQVYGQLGEINITENGTYDPLLDGYDGYSKVYVNVLGGERKQFYTVRFYDGNRLLETNTQVPYGGNAICTKTDKLSGSVFTGWNPNPVNVTRDMNCYAVYSSPGVGIAGEYTETISDSWSQIITKVKTGNRVYPEGSTKFLRLKGSGGVEYLLNMMLISWNTDANRNGGTANTTWININHGVTRFEAAPSGGATHYNQNHLFGVFSTVRGSYDSWKEKTGNQAIWWGNSLAKAIFNGDPSQLVYISGDEYNDLTYFNSLSNLGLLLPNLIDQAAGTSLFKEIVQVDKYSYKRSFSGTNVYDEKDRLTYDKIWIPSTRELCYPLIPTQTTIPTSMCTTGITYSNPNYFTLNSLALGYSGPFATRDCGTYTSPAVQPLIRNMSIDSNSDPARYGKGYIGGGNGSNYFGSEFRIGFCL